jgi:hypothetical protein
MQLVEIPVLVARPPKHAHATVDASTQAAG